ncbi:MAG: right-handed parallel beta-helix repeat-containing protein [Acidobacteriota bacterium]|nr:right-handed parallel beta-helix repeat-containing protein [Acidobacteriota bacterium]
MRKLYLFVSFVALCTLPSPAWATTGTLTITTNTTLTEDHIGGTIIIAADNVTLNCAGHFVLGPPERNVDGIRLDGRTGVTVENCRVAFFQRGISLTASHRNVFRRNQIYNNTAPHGVLETGGGEGFDLNGSSGNTFINNSVTNNRDGFDLIDSDGNVFTRNEVTHNARNGFELDRSDNNVFVRNTANDNGLPIDEPNPTPPPPFIATPRGRNGFSLDFSGGNTFIGNTANRNGRNGFRIQHSNDNTFLTNEACFNNAHRFPGEADAFQERSFRNVFFNNTFCTGDLQYIPSP